MTGVNGSKLRLMVVDDEVDNLDLLYRTFRRQFQVFKANSAFEALEVLEREGEMGIIISDQRMPQMNGTEFLSRAAEQFPDTIRILLTGYTDVEDLVGAINTGKVFKYVTKPWSPNELEQIVQQAAETYRVLKQRTEELHRALRRESLFNAVMTAIRGSLDYRSMLKTIVKTLGQTFEADACWLYPIESSLEQFNPQNGHYGLHPTVHTEASMRALIGDRMTYLSEPSQHLPLEPEPSLLLTAAVNHEIQLHSASAGEPYTQLVVPLVYQQDCLAVIVLYKTTTSAVSTINTGSPWSSEDTQLLGGVAEQAALAISQAKLYQRIQKQTEQMQAELAVARQIQSNLLRQTLPELDSVRVQACCYPAREVGGDFFEVYAHPQGDVWIAVGDVSGKGVPAALFMASAISVLRRELSQESPPEPNVVMQNLNRSLLDDLVESNCFITMVLARYSPTTQQLVYANAGHIYPLVWAHHRVKTHAIATQEVPDIQPNYLKTRGVPLGILPVWQAPAGTTSLQSGEVLLLTSDGITEATIIDQSNNGIQSTSMMLKQSGLWRLLMQEQGSLDLNALLAHIQAHNPIQEDDQTILSLEVL